MDFFQVIGLNLIISEIFLEAQKRNQFDAKLHLSGSHLKSEYGNTLKEIHKLKIKNK